MANQNEYMKYVDKAQQGEKNALDRLSELGAEYLRTYIYRLTLDADLTEDIVQDSLLEMVRSIEKLKKPESFLSWLRVIAVNNMYSRFKKRGREKAFSLQHAEYHASNGSAESANQESEMEKDEWRQIIFNAMRLLNPRHRQVLVMRCYEDLDYSQIAREMNCSEFNVRVLFFRAKNSLKKHLLRRGIARNLFLPSLCLFGQLTRRLKAEPVTIPAQTLGAGTAASIVGAVTTKIGLTIMAALSLTALTIVGVNISDSNNFSLSLFPTPPRSQVKSFYYMEQDWGRTGEFNQNLGRGRSLSRGCYEQWFYFPEGVDGPMFLMMQRWDPQLKDRLCGWLQNDKANYYYNSGSNTVHIYQYNLPLLGLQTRRLPSDTPEFTDFLDSCEGKIKNIDYYRDPNTQILMGALDDRFSNARNYEYSILYNTLEKTTFDSFRYDWPEDASVIDERDNMHKRGWTYFAITGKIGDDWIAGRGRIPFVYDKYNEYQPWLELNIGDRLMITDSPSGAYIADAEENIIAVYPAGNFFTALARPWMGIHTADLVRREAVKKHIRFTTQISDYNPDESQYELATVNLLQEGGDNPAITYSINVTADLVEKIEFFENEKPGGQLVFNYLDDITQTEDDFTQPQKRSLPADKLRQKTGIDWLNKLADANLIE